MINEIREMFERLTNQDFILKLVKIVWGTRLVRTGCLIALLGAFSLTGIGQYIVLAMLARLGLAVNAPEYPAWVGFGVLLAGVVTAMSGATLEYFGERLKPNPHDVQLLRKFRALIPDSILEHLREHDFGNSFARRWTDGVLELSGHWTGPRYEFVATDVQSAFKLVREAAQQFSHLLSVYTFVHDQDMDWQTARPSTFRDDEMTKREARNIKQINDAATAFVQMVDEFERLARRRIPDSQDTAG